MASVGVRNLVVDGEALAVDTDVVAGLQVFQDACNHFARGADAIGDFLLGRTVLDNQQAIGPFCERLQCLGDASVDTHQGKRLDAVTQQAHAPGEFPDQIQREFRMTAEDSGKVCLGDKPMVDFMVVITDAERGAVSSRASSPK